MHHGSREGSATLLGIPMTFHEPKIIDVDDAPANETATGPAPAGHRAEDDSGVRAVEQLGWSEDPKIEVSEIDPRDADLLAPFIVQPPRLGFGKETMAVLAPVFVVQLARPESPKTVPWTRWVMLAAAVCALLLCTACVAYAL